MAAWYRWIATWWSSGSDQRLRSEASIGTSSDGIGSIPVDKARLRENARIVRTIQGELGDLYQVRGERQRKELREKRWAGKDLGTPDEGMQIGFAEAQLLRVLTKAFLELTEEVAG